jgi:hypothetical protein
MEMVKTLSNVNKIEKLKKIKSAYEQQYFKNRFKLFLKFKPGYLKDEGDRLSDRFLETMIIFPVLFLSCLLFVVLVCMYDYDSISTINSEKIGIDYFFAVSWVVMGNVMSVVLWFFLSFFVMAFTLMPIEKFARTFKVGRKFSNKDILMLAFPIKELIKSSEVLPNNEQTKKIKYLIRFYENENALPIENIKAYRSFLHAHIEVISYLNRKIEEIRGEELRRFENE